jgi:RimJ/RimL family protein N-acetyltransferase
MTLHIANAPRLQTARLVLRLPQASDFDVWADCMASDRAKFIGGPVERQFAWRSFCHLSGHWMMRGYGMFIFADPETDAPYGMTGPWFPEGWPEQEIGWTVWVAGLEGKGYALEAASAARAWAYGSLGWTTAISLIDAGNTRSIALAQRMGAAYEADFTHSQYGQMQVWRHPGVAV